MKLLHIVATPRAHTSNTARISNHLIEKLYIKYDDLEVEVLDLFRADLPAVSGENIESKYMLMTGQELDAAHQNSWKLIEDNITTFLAADIYVITTPMWNFSIPYALKYYIDAIVQPGYLFKYDENGTPIALVHGKKMVCVTTRGGDYSKGGPLESLDFVENYLRTIFNFVGISDMHFINAQPMDITPDLRKAAIKQAFKDVDALLEEDHWHKHDAHDVVEFPEGAKPQVEPDN